MSEKAGIWIRVSSGKQDEQNQIPAVEKHCTAHKYTVARRYELHDRSAYHGEQQAKLDEMLADVRAHRIKVLVIWHSDRLERRGGLDLLNLLAAIRDAGGRVESVEEPLLGKLDMGGQVTTFLGGIMNHEKSLHLSQDVKKSFDTIRANGALVGRPPWGYTTTGDKMHKMLIPTDEGRRLIPEVYRRVIAGESLGTIAEWLTLETGRQWWARTVGSMIRNPVFMGSRCSWDVATRSYGKTLHRCDPLVPADVWKRAGAALDTRPKRGPQVAENRAMLSGVLFCPACQMSLDTASPMYRITTRQGVFYRCAGRGAQRKGCSNMVPLADADTWADRAIRREWDKPVMERRVIPGHDHAAEIEAVRFEIRQLAQLDLDDDEYDRRLVLLRSERDRLVSLPSVPDQIVDVDTGRNYAAEWVALTGSERAGWLKDNHIRVMISRDERAIAWVA